MSRDTQPVPQLPATFGGGRYRVTHRLGTGGMGLVVRARDEVLHRDVAIKVLADNLAADAGARERFDREARAAAAIHDARVVTVHDVGEEDGRPYLVMELVDGPALSELLAADGPLPGDDVADVAIDALVGLARAHEAGLLHRDVKPGNLLRAPDGTVKVTDFGVAVVADAPGLTRTGFVVGTAGYLAPERRRGEPGTVASDLWSLGATLTELVTGYPPGDEATAVLARLGDEVPGALRVLLATLLEDDPARRPASALDALMLLGGDPRAPAGVSAPPPGRQPTAVLPVTGSGEASPVAGSDAPTEALAATAAARQTDVLRHAGATAAPADVPLGGDDPTRWTKVAIVAVLLLLGVLVVQALGDGSDEPAEADSFTVEVDPDDPAGSARELARLLRDGAGD